MRERMRNEGENERERKNDESGRERAKMIIEGFDMEIRAYVTSTH